MLSHDDQNELEKMSHAFRQLPGLVFWKDVDSVYYGGNDAHRRLMRFQSFNEISHRTDYDMPFELSKFASIFRSQDQQVMQSKEELKIFEMFKIKGGDFCIQFDRKTPLFNKKGQVIGVIGQGFNLLQTGMTEMFTQLVKLDQRYSGKMNQSCYEVSNSNTHLTEAQEECLFYFLRGQTSKHIAAITGRSHRTVEVHLEALKTKFSCASKALLIEKAIALGYLTKLPKRLLTRQLSVILSA